MPARLATALHAARARLAARLRASLPNEQCARLTLEVMPTDRPNEFLAVARRGDEVVKRMIIVNTSVQCAHVNHLGGAP